MLRPGDPTPDVTLLDLEGTSVQLSNVWQQDNLVLLIFLRHLG